MSFPEMWAELAAIGRTDNGYRRFAFTPAERECAAWFRAQAAVREMPVEMDGNGNEVAWWPGPAAGAVITGSHLDSVPDGGAFDGPLGVVSAFAAVDQLRTAGFVPARSIGIAVFVEEEGARSGIACMGSRLMTGLLPADRAAEFIPEPGKSNVLRDPAVYIELHIEQGRVLESSVGIGTAIWPHGRWRLEFTGAANHAGTTALADRRDPMLSFAETVLSARKKAGQHGALATFGRVQVEPNGTNAIPWAVRAWLDARAPDEATLAALVDDIEKHARNRIVRDGTDLALTAESVSPAVQFASPVVDRIRSVLPAAPLLPTGAGHDAGVLATAGIPAAMLFVRNPSGVSHAPAEFATEDDCLAGVSALADVLREFACR